MLGSTLLLVLVPVVVLELSAAGAGDHRVDVMLPRRPGTTAPARDRRPPPCCAARRAPPRRRLRASRPSGRCRRAGRSPGPGSARAATRVRRTRSRSVAHPRASRRRRGRRPAAQRRVQRRGELRGGERGPRTSTDSVGLACRASSTSRPRRPRQLGEPAATSSTSLAIRAHASVTPARVSPRRVTGAGRVPPGRSSGTRAPARRTRPGCPPRRRAAGKSLARSSSASRTAVARPPPGSQRGRHGVLGQGPRHHRGVAVHLGEVGQSLPDGREVTGAGRRRRRPPSASAQVDDVPAEEAAVCVGGGPRAAAGPAG